MNPIVSWTAELLVAAWQRQEREGRYRGADDFRALHIDPADAIASWRAATGADEPWPDGLAGGFADLTLPVGFGLDPAERLLAVLAVSVELETRLRPLVAALTDDPTLRQPTLGLAIEVAGAVRLPARQVRAAADPDGRLAVLDLLALEVVTGRPARVDAQLVATDWLIGLLDGGTPADPPGLRRMCGIDRLDGTADAVPAREGPARDGPAREGPAPAGPADVGSEDHVAGNGFVGALRPRLFAGADHVAHAQAWGHACVIGSAADRRGLSSLLRAARLAGDGILVALSEAPEPWLIAAVERACELGWPVACSLPAGAVWVPPAGWRQENVSPVGSSVRAARWHTQLAAHGLRATEESVSQVAVEYALGLDAVDDAALRVAAHAGSARPPAHGEPAAVDLAAIDLSVSDSQAATVGLAALRLAARRTAWRDLSSCARPGPTGNTWDDLVVADAVRGQLLDIAAAIGQRGRVLDEWGFGTRPGSRGYHVLFAGPSGTGKTMSAGVIAAESGLELWVVDLARVVDKYLGETEKAIDKVLRAAQSCGAMLLFDEADALFGRRGEVREAKDRWANVEVAFLLQRIEEHDGVTVLTTNVSHHLDEAFARRMSQRVEFSVPDARLRRRLWHRSIPDKAPLANAADLITIAEHFELAGGAIRSAALNAAYAAAADAGPIALPHLVRASVRELSKAGRTPTRSDLGDLGIHMEEAGWRS